MIPTPIQIYLQQKAGFHFVIRSKNTLWVAEIRVFTGASIIAFEDTDIDTAIMKVAQWIESGGSTENDNA